MMFVSIRLSSGSVEAVREASMMHLKRLARQIAVALVLAGLLWYLKHVSYICLTKLLKYKQ